MAYTTTIYPAKAALDTLLRAHTWSGTAPYIAWGAPSEQEDVELDQIYQGATDVEEVTFETLSLRNDEDYQLRLIVDTRMYGDEEKSAEELAWTRVNEVLTLVKANMTLSGTVQRLTGFNLTVGTAPSAANQWRAQILIEIGVVGLVAP